MHPAFKSYLEKAEKSVTALQDDFFQNIDGSMNTQLVEMSTTLHFILITLCEEQAATCLKQSSEPNGFENWRILHQRFTVSMRATAVGRLTTIIQPHFKMESLEESLASWEEKIQKYEKETSSQLADKLKIALLTAHTKKGPLQHHLRLNAGSLKK